MNTFLMVSGITTALYAVDILSQYLYVHMGPGGVDVPHNARWFFIHAFSNCIIALLGSEDLLYCAKHSGTCASQGWGDASFSAFLVAFTFHLYHIVFFWHKLSVDEWVHHGIMVGLSAPLSVY